jgi:hypothetical protein
MLQERRRMGQNMKKATWCLLATLMLWAGCAVGPRLQGTSLGDKPVYTAYLGDRPLFAIVTDGATGSYGVKNTILIGATYSGQIVDRKSGKTIEFRSASGGRTLRLDGRHYDFVDGRLLLVSVKTDPLRVKQLEVSEEELQSLTTTDERITAFFQRSEPH